MMDRNFLLAMSAAIALVVGYNLYYQWRFGDYVEKQRQTEMAKLEQQHKEKAAGQEPGAAATSAEPVAGQPKPQTGATAQATVPESEKSGETVVESREHLIHIKTGVTDIYLSNKGATPVQYVLDKYHDAHQRNIDIAFNMPAYIEATSKDSDKEELRKIKTYPLIGFSFPKESFSDKVNKAYFTTTESGNEITLKPGDQPYTISFQLPDDSGVVIEKTYTFYPGEYRFDLAVTVKSTEKWGAFDYNLVWYGLGDEPGDAVSSMYSYHGPVLMLNGERIAREPDSKETQHKYNGSITWGALANRYFTAAMIPEDPKNGVLTTHFIDSTHSYLTWAYKASLDGAPVKFSVYFGPKEHAQLSKYTNGMFSIIDYGWFDFFAKPLFWFLNVFHDATGNWGWAIILLTMMAKAAFFPLTQKSFTSMQKMQKLQPHLKRLQETYKDDKEKLNQAMLQLYREHKVNPLGGCLPMVLQIPIFFALYKVLLESIELKGADFILWIHDLSLQDPYYVTPLLMGASMFVQQLMTPATGDPVQRKMMLALPVVFTFMFLTFPSGLVIYWLVNNVLTIGQQWLIKREAK